jgi:hypothetical protein
MFMVSGGSESYHCPKHGVMSCPICGSVLVEIEYKGKKPHFLALTKRDDFRGFVGCLRVDLHDKVVDVVDYRGKVYVRSVFHGCK